MIKKNKFILCCCCMLLAVAVNVIGSNSTLNNNIILYSDFNNNLNDTVDNVTAWSPINCGVGLDYVPSILDDTVENVCDRIDAIVGDGIFSTSAQWSTNLWFKYNAVHAGDNGFIYHTKTNNRIRIRKYMGADSETLFMYVGGVLVTFENVTTNIWHMASFTSDGSNVVAYHNTNLLRFTDNNVVGDKISGKIRLNQNHNGLSEFNGITDEVGVWTRPLTFKEIVELYNAGENITTDQQYPMTSSKFILVSEMVYPDNQNEYPLDNKTYVDNYNGSIIIDTSSISNCSLNDSRWSYDSDNGTRHFFINNTIIGTGTYDINVICEDSFNNISLQIVVFSSCVPNFICNGYGACNITDLAPCNSTLDNNSCGSSYTGNFSEFTPQSCNFCSPDLTLLSFGNCNINNISNNTYIDNNFFTCCNLTQLIPSDCPFGTVTQTGTINDSCVTSDVLITFTKINNSFLFFFGFVIWGVIFLFAIATRNSFINVGLSVYSIFFGIWVINNIALPTFLPTIFMVLGVYISFLSFKETATVNS